MEFNHFLSSFYPDTNYGGAKLYRDMVEQVNAFIRGKEERGEAGKGQQLSLLRVAWPATSDKDRAAKLHGANDYYERFDNVFSGPGEVSHGAIKPLPATRTLDELADNTLVCTQQELIDRLGLYADAGVDEIALNFNIGFEQRKRSMPCNGLQKRSFHCSQKGNARRAA